MLPKNTGFHEIGSQLDLAISFFLGAMVFAGVLGIGSSLADLNSSVFLSLAADLETSFTYLASNLYSTPVPPLLV